MTGKRFDEAAISVGVLEQVDRLCLDFERAYRASRSPSLESYLEQLPEECFAAALYYLIRLERELMGGEGRTPTVQEYLGRFPDYRQLVELACDAPRLCEVKLEVIIGPHHGRSFSFRQHDSFIVGRATCAHFRLPMKDPYISRVHLLVEVNPPCCRLVDMCSLSGTKVNGKKVDQIDLQDGDLIQAGDTMIRVSIFMPESDLPPTTEPPPRRNELHSKHGVLVAAGSFSQPQASDLPNQIPGFELLTEIGRGGMGIVYRAKRLDDDMQVAIKTIRSACPPSDYEVRRFLREAQILCLVKHPNIVPFQQFGCENGLFYIVMDFVQGSDAAQLLSKHGPLPIGRAIRVMCQALEALQYAHEKGFVHRDVKPGNLLLSGHGMDEVCQLADFGLARLYVATRMSGLTLMGDIGGTLPFMAPEQITSFHNAKPAADQYGAAATFYYLCTQHHLYVDDPNCDAGQIVKDALISDPVPMHERRADIPPALSRIVHKALAKKPSDRFANVRDFRAALSSFDQ